MKIISDRNLLRLLRIWIPCSLFYSLNHVNVLMNTSNAPGNVVYKAYGGLAVFIVSLCLAVIIKIRERRRREQVRQG